MESQAYRSRIVDDVIADELLSVGALVIEGAKWCGKSTSARHHCKSAVYMDNPSKRGQYSIMLQTNPEAILAGATPRLIDEWQLFPLIWDSVRYTVDHRRGMGQFILTGSSRPADRSQIMHSGTGRFAWIRMRPMSLQESLDSSGAISLEKLFSNPESNIYAECSADLERMAFLTCRGGWPAIFDLPAKNALKPAFNYFNAVVNVDIRDVDGVNRSSERAKTLMRSYARFQGTQTPLSQIVNDVNGSDFVSIDEKTARNYIDALESMFVIEEAPAWNPNLKSKTAIRSTSTRYFVDPSIATAALGVGPKDLINDLKCFGLIFETLCMRDLRVYAQPLGGTVYHYRDKNGLECDAVVHLPNGNYGLIEIKLGGEEKINEGADNLNRLTNKLDTSKMKAPSFRMVLTAVGSFAYRRPDGILVVPVTALGR